PWREWNPSTRALRLGKLLSTQITNKDGSTPAIQFCRRARRTWNSVIGLRYAEHRSNLGQDPKESFHKENDHLFDALGYALMAAPLPEAKPENREVPGITKPFTPDEVDRYEQQRYEQANNSVGMFGIDI
ncbi:MAG: hypothetical protein EBS84_22430, partial [Proteobacteria bacterium]|nr:hypothetical protein [Pseudomonadota bacterium]